MQFQFKALRDVEGRSQESEEIRRNGGSVASAAVENKTLVRHAKGNVKALACRPF